MSSSASTKEEMEVRGERKAVILLSGGLDSATAAAIARDQGYSLHAISFQYGQKHNIELESAKKIVQHFKIADHKISEIDLALFGGSALTDQNVQIPTQRSQKEMEGEIPVTYVPARNLIFLSYALAFAETIGSFDIFIGVNAVDYSGYPDCRPEFIKSFELTANLATALGAQSIRRSGANSRKITIHTPLISMTKAEIITIGTNLGVDYSLTHSCYSPTRRNEACGICDSCILRLNGFSQANLTDPVRYENRLE